ncbi:FimV/HubP family polar landmark protein [Janthinobacterium sp. 17J80-10]|uniref:FimV/HubP family polar landmark protein n=1 Tax=Janthinobacterium sp. 17J80-10 TaxID=2497863 RepID=UPI0013E8EEBF|nr:FimV/HubP family polar landmark protein [Janthinobacterium sp. 17J80-10]
MPVLRTIALVVIAAWGSAGYAAGLGPIRVQSALGHPLRASVPVFGAETPYLTASCITARLEHPDGILITLVQATVGSGSEASSIRLSTRQPVNEPAVILNLSVACGAAVQRNYQLLLDPVVTLPQLAQAPQAAPAIAPSRRNANGEQAMLAPAEGGGQATDVPRRAVQRKVPGKADAAPASEAAPMRSGRKVDSVRQDARKVVRSVLKLSSDDVGIDGAPVFAPGLKLSDTLSESRDTGDAQKAAELKAAYARFAMVMRGEDPVTAGEKQLLDAQARLRELEQQVAKLKVQGEQQHLADKAALASLERNTVSSGWAAILGVLLAAALAALGWLYLRQRKSARRQDGAFWDTSGTGPATELDEWGNTLGVDETFAAAAPASSARGDSEPSDWEQGMPLDDTLAVDWASRQAHRQEPVLQTLKVARARRQQEHLENDFSVTELPAIAEFPEVSASPGAPDMPPATPMPASRAPDDSQSFETVRKAANKRNSAVQPMKVEEISDLMQEAEFWMLLNDPEHAIEILATYSGVDRPVSPVPWIYLLDLYRVTGQQENYQSLAARIKSVFNTNAPAWNNEDGAGALRSLRDYPHVVEKIEELWEGAGIVPYLESLLLDEREGARTGFDLAVYREVIHLIGVARDPETPRKREQLSFDDPQPRLISQTVSMPKIKTDMSVPSIADEEADFFDRATSQQATSRQVISKPAIPKAAAVTPAPVKAQEAIPQDLQVALEMPQPSAPARQASGGNIEPEIVRNGQEVAEDALAKDSRPDSAPADAPVNAADDDAERTADMARKLDLVEAYQEIGENVGARVLLEEVIQGGTPLQIEKAKAMLKRLLKEIDWQ